MSMVPRLLAHCMPGIVGYLGMLVWGLSQVLVLLADESTAIGSR